MINTLCLYVLLIQVGLLGRGVADYVETAPRPGAPLPPAISRGDCPLVFLQSDIRHAKDSACSSSVATTTANGADLPTRCCNQIRAALFQARTRYANDTGRLLLPQASADACVQNFKASLLAAGVPDVGNCNITSATLSEETGEACGSNLTTVYDFWSATNRTFPGTVGASCYVATQGNCGLCTTLITNKILSLGGSTTALLSTPTCQGLAQIAMTAAAYPVAMANGISQCLHAVDITPIIPAAKCTAFDWEAQNFTSIALSCGPAQIRPDRCCDLIIGMFGQQNGFYFQKTGSPIPQEEAQVCFSVFKEALLAHGVSLFVLDTCGHASAATPLISVGCYNYTTAYQRVPSRYMNRIAASCNRSTSDCSRCRPTLYGEVANELANTDDTSYFSSCAIMLALQFSASLSSLDEITAWQNCYFRFPPPLTLSPPISPSSAGIKWWLVGTLSGVGIMVLLLVILAVVVVKRFPLTKVQYNSKLAVLSRMSSIRKRALQQRLQIYSRKQLEKATGNFDDSQLLGSGASGKVYVGELNGEVVAIKVAIIKTGKNGAKEAWNEIATLARYRHRHLVFLKGCCFLEPHCSLVYEFVEQGSLEDHLYPVQGGTQQSFRSSESRFLDWPTREKVALGTARGLIYLHNDCVPQCIHRDVKPSNILLTRDFEAKLSDFGLAKQTDADVTHVTTAVAGTWGFLSPEYVATGKLTDKSDVYSFGVVLLTLVAGRRPTVQDVPPEQVHLTEWAWTLAERNELRMLFDRQLSMAEREEHAESMERMARIALLCVHTTTSIRPTMLECADMLLQETEVPRLPRRPMTLYSISSLASSPETGTAS
ncbi:Putative Serine/Threonine protein kinase [Klebsormidium nitens]|uniref:Putative Serine/Threonine protein kinase n=1 Tax=Klebsormidium nitens TaxID=105231 RepID=A0A1Y1IEU1_KLENI|nr:Putative Serine/Threonine protein kinase [Klebsormidium nitens]|eukprot:GAQ89420.1 Putative Serine/Threonine protein kinase [Klebsormidium nitens]